VDKRLIGPAVRNSARGQYVAVNSRTLCCNSWGDCTWFGVRCEGTGGDGDVRGVGCAKGTGGDGDFGAVGCVRILGAMVTSEV
jgi:hypothetical protein